MAKSKKKSFLSVFFIDNFLVFYYDVPKYKSLTETLKRRTNFD